MAETIPLKIQSLDIQDVSIRLLRIYIDEFDNLDARAKPYPHVMAIEENVNPATWYSRLKIKHNKSLFKSIKFNKISMTYSPKTSIPSTSANFFDPSVKFNNDNECQSWFWKIKLQYSASIVAGALFHLMSNLSSVLEMNSFSTRILQDGKVSKLEIPFEEFEFWILPHIANEHYLFQDFEDNAKTINSFDTFYQMVHFMIGSEKRNLVFDPTLIQYGVRGQKGEIVGMIQNYEFYKTRFPGIIKEQERHSYNHNSVEFQMMYTLGGFLDRRASDETTALMFRIVKRFTQELIYGVQWCGYCGNFLPRPFKCIKCKVKNYCGKECQKADWKSHKMTCVEPSV